MKFKLFSKFKPAGDQPKAIKELIESVKTGNRYQTLLGVTGSGKTFIMANVIEKIGKPALVIAPNKTLAAQLYSEYKNFFPKNKVCYFVSYYDYYQPEAYIPVTDTYIDKEAMINEEIDRLRHFATSALMTRKDVIIVASVSCIYNLGVPETYFGATLNLHIDKPITRGDLIRQLVKMHFERTPGSLKRGTFRVRGDVFEIMPASEEVIYRVELKEQKVSDIALVDYFVKDGNKFVPQKELIIFPPKHFISTEPERERAMKEIKAELKERLLHLTKSELLLEAERLERRTKYDLEMIKTLGYCHGIENYSRHLVGKLPGESPSTLLDYFGAPDGFLTIIDESHIAVPQIRGMYNGDQSRKQVLVQHGFRLPSAMDNRPLNFKEFKERAGQIVFTSATPGDFEFENSKKVIEAVIRPTGLIDPEVEVRSIFDKKTQISQIDDLVKEILKRVVLKERTLALTLTKKMSEELSEFLLARGIKAKYLHSDIKTLERATILTDFRKGVFDVLVGINLLREGLDLPEVSLVAILDADKEGFLRSDVSLIQTMGRAARNINGKVILYADRLTGSLKEALRQTNYRRNIQLAYNKKHGITPKGIIKSVEQMLPIETIDSKNQ
ncbi:MAG: excinuclease ABC subunit UvrB [Candidatus Azambacteria bacterium]|nr:excinuclease ABC subunit UvrB [Candidatus Azambacteria bacterium]